MDRDSKRDRSWQHECHPPWPRAARSAALDPSRQHYLLSGDLRRLNLDVEVEIEIAGLEVELAGLV